MQASDEGALASQSSGGVRLVALLAPPLLLAGYAVAAMLSPLLSRSPLAIAFLAILFMLSMSVALTWFGKDPLDPFRLISGCFALTYCIAPLFADEYDWYVRESIASLLAKGAAIALLAYAAIALGYFLPLLRSARLSPSITGPFFRRVQRDQTILLAAILYFVGAVSFVIMFILAGGTDRIIASDETRVTFFWGVGYLYHFSYFMYSGAALYFVALLAQRARPLRSPWLAGWPFVLTALFFAILQRRSAAVMSLVIFIVISHYMIKQIRITRAMSWTLALVPLVIFIGYARHPSVRGLLLVDPGVIVVEVADKFGDLLQSFLGHDVNRLKQAMLALDHFPRSEPHRWGETLLITFNPLFRLFGFAGSQQVPLGRNFLLLANPELPEWVQSGYHPSMVGEALANVPWFATPALFAGYGLVVRWIYQRLVATRRDPISLAVYAVMVFRVIDMIIVGVGQLLFEIIVVSVPILLLRPILLKPAPEPTSSLTDPEAPVRRRLDPTPRAP